MTNIESGGLINLFSQHRVAGNLLMIMLILFGVYGLANLSRQVLPDFTLDIININVVWPGASPADVEANILEAIEPEVRGCQCPCGRKDTGYVFAPRCWRAPRYAVFGDGPFYVSAALSWRR